MKIMSIVTALTMFAPSAFAENTEGTLKPINVTDKVEWVKCKSEFDGKKIDSSMKNDRELSLHVLSLEQGMQKMEMYSLVGAILNAGGEAGLALGALNIDPSSRESLELRIDPVGKVTSYILKGFEQYPKGMTCKVNFKE
jgi:hypothetical protein